MEELTKDEKKRVISEYLDKTGKKRYPSEIAEELHINYDLCMEIVEELLDEGTIEIVEE